VTPDRGPRRRTQQEQDALWGRPWQQTPEHLVRDMQRDVVCDFGWGRLVFAQTFDDPVDVLHLLRAEEEGKRDIGMYIRDPHVLVAQAPDEVFIDPSYTFRLSLHRYRPRREVIPGVIVRTMGDVSDAVEVNRIYTARDMVTAPPELMWSNHRTRTYSYLVAEDERTGDIVGTVTGIDHTLAFDDPDSGTSLWCLAVDPQTSLPGVGEALVRALIERYIGRGRDYLDLSVMYDNEPAITLYRKLGFRRVPVFSVKRKNRINEPLFAPSATTGLDELNPYARIIADEARQRGIRVEVLDPSWGELKLVHGGRRVITREALSELTTAVAMSRCDDKRIARRIFTEAGLTVARGMLATGDTPDTDLLAEVGELVVKPSRGEQGRGITVGVTTREELETAIGLAAALCPDVLLEERVEGQDLRVVVIGDDVVAAAVRQPATVIGNGRQRIRDLISAQSRRRSAATGGESVIPLDTTTETVVRDAGYELDDVLPDREHLAVRRTANLHTGGTINDVTAELHPALADAAIEASRALDLPVTGIDMMVPAVDEPNYVMIEANERPGLANHEPQPVAQRFIDLLFPATKAPPRGWRPEPRGGT